jgi:hypothetical protein
MHNYFDALSLTPALSRWERENYLQVLEQAEIGGRQLCKKTEILLGNPACAA